MRKLGILLAVVLFGLMVFAEVDIDSLVNRIELLEEYANMIYDTVGTKVNTEDFENYAASVDERLSQIDILMNRIELLEEYANMIYEMVGTKVNTEDFEMFTSELDERISAVETDILNIKNTIDTGLPALRDMLYELSDNLAALEERLTSYIEVSINSLKEEMVKEGITTEAPNNDFETALEDIKVTLDIHDNDILKIYETLGTLADQIAALEEKIIDPEAIETLTLKVDMHDQDIVNIYDNLSQKADREQVDLLEASVTELYDSVDGLNQILTGLAAQIGDTDYLLRKQIENLGKDIDEKLANYATKEEVTKMLGDSEKKFNEKLNNVNTIAWLGLVIGAVAVILPFVVK